MDKLITYSYLRGESGISQTIDNEKLDNPIKEAQDYLRSLLGISFYNQLVSQVITTPQTLSAVNDAFFDPYVKEFLSAKAYEIYLAKASVQEKRIGLTVLTEPNSQPASDKQIGELLSLARERIKYKREAMIAFLMSAQRVSSSAYPLFTNSACGVSQGGFGISAVSKTDTVNFSIDNQVRNSEPHGPK